jgi:hypothetical protein
METKSFNFDDFELSSETDLGSGYISKVKLAKHKATGVLYAVKIVSL